MRTVLCILEAEETSEVARAEAIREAWPGARFAAGVHPHHAGRYAGEIEAALGTVRGALDASGACAVGEIGLDYHYDFSPQSNTVQHRFSPQSNTVQHRSRAVQQEIFRAQIRLAHERDLPVIIHTREAAADTFRILREEGCRRGVFHCFTGDEAMAREALELGFHLSFAGILTFPKAAALREVARQTPLDRVLSETDAPYLAPVPHRGKRNEPAFVTRVVETLADLHGGTREAMAGRIRENFRALFG